MIRRVLMLAIFATACGGPSSATFGPSKVEIPVSDGSRARHGGGSSSGPSESPPASGRVKESPFPAVARSKLANGMGVAVVTARALPVVQIRVVVNAGTGYGAIPGVAELTGAMLKDGGTREFSSAELLRRVETLGADLSVDVDRDATTIGLAVTKDHLGEAMALLAQVVREPRFDGEEWRKLKSRETDAAEDAARSRGAFTATRLVFRELYPEKSPYTTFGLVPSEIAKVDSAAIRDFHRRFYVPKAAEIVFAGDVEVDAAKAIAEEHFGKWTGGDAPKIDFPAPRAMTKTRVIIAHRPKSAQSDVYIALLAPPRTAPDWTSVRVANQVLGGGVASRLFADVREQRSLAYRTNVQILDVTHGSQPLVAIAGTETAKTAQTVAALVENIAKMTSTPPTDSEAETARRYLSDIFAIRMETIGSIADMIVQQDVFGLPDGYWDAYRRDLKKTTAADATEAAKKMYVADKALIVVAGDADVIAPELARFGEVTIVDPEKEFKTVRTVPEAK